jgi:hypothetical protein
MIKASIIGLFSVIWKAACRKLPVRCVITYALATVAFTRAWLIGAVAGF